MILQFLLLFPFYFHNCLSFPTVLLCAVFLKIYKKENSFFHYFRITQYYFPVEKFLVHSRVYMNIAATSVSHTIYEIMVYVKF